MSDLGISLDYFAVAVGLIVSGLVIGRQLFGDDGLLSTGWNKRERAIRIIRGRYPDFDAIYRKIDTYRPPKHWGVMLAIATGFIPQIPFLLIVSFPNLKQPTNVFVFITGTGIGVWLVSIYIATRARKFETLTRPLSSSETNRLTRLRFLQGRLVLGWYNFPIQAVSLGIGGIIAATAISSIETYSLTIAAGMLFALLVGFATIDSLSAIGGAAYSDFRNRTTTVPKVRVSLKDSAGGEPTVTGLLLAIGSECIIRTGDNFEERIDWQHLGRLAVEAMPTQPVSALPGPAQSTEHA
jgi:hypothetical protein